MNHSLRLQLQWYLRHDSKGLGISELNDYIWHVEQLLQELRQRLLHLLPPPDLGMPTKP